MKRSRVKPISEDRIEFLAELDAITPALYARAGHRCERCGSTYMLVRHHKQGRTPKDANTLAKLALLCDPCHRYTHDHPTESYEAGWMIRRN